MRFGKQGKWVLSIIAVVALGGLAMALLGRKSVHAEIVIPSPPSAVWAVLTDASRYKEWNPVFVDVQGEYREGAKLRYQMRSVPPKKSCDLRYGLLHPRQTQPTYRPAWPRPIFSLSKRVTG